MNHELTTLALRSFVNTINLTGGIFIDDEGVWVPAGDPTWSDLALAYLEACTALEVEPKKVKTPQQTRRRGQAARRL
jgi:hypothetical protein